MSATVWLLIAAVACRPDFEPPPLEPPGRVVDVFGEAWLEDVPREEVLAPPDALLDQGFERKQSLAGWRTCEDGAGTVTREAIAGGHALRIAADPGPAEELVVVCRNLRVEPLQRYRLTGRVRTEALLPVGKSGAGASVELVERKKRGAEKEETRRDHLTRVRGTRAEWTELSMEFTTGRHSRSLEVRLVAAHGKATGAAFFDDLHLRPVGRTELVAGLPSAGAPSERVRAITLGEDRRPALLLPLDSTWSFQAPIDRATRLDFATAAARESQDVPVCFEARSGGDEAPFWQRCVGVDDEDRHLWRDQSLELPPGARVRLSLRGDDGGRAWGLWADPRLSELQPTPDPRPNLVLMIFDTLRADHLGSYAYDSRPTSPALDAFSQRSVRFQHARSPSPWTSPSIATMLTGLYPSQHGTGRRMALELRVDDTAAEKRRRNQLDYQTLDPAVPLVTERLRAAGYDTAGFVTNYFASAPIGFARGMDRFVKYSGSGVAGATEGRSKLEAWLADREARPTGRPFFLVLHFVDPHTPYRMRIPPPEGFEKPIDLPVEAESRQGFDAWTLRSLGGIDRDVHMDQVEAMYDAEIRWLDDTLAAVLPQLEAQDAAILAAADHGEGFDEHGMMSHGNSLYDELVRVPMWLRLPGGERSGEVVEQPVSLIDVAPTLTALGGVAPLASPGRSLLEIGDARPLFLEFVYAGPDLTGVVQGKWKYLLQHPALVVGSSSGRRGMTSKFGSEFLFDVEADPGELLDQAASEPEVVETLRGAVLDYLGEHSPGIHLRCRVGEPALPVTVKTPTQIEELMPLTRGPGDKLRVDAARQELAIEWAGAGLRQVVIRSRSGGVQVDGPVVQGGETVASASWSEGELEALGSVAGVEVPEGTCVIGWVGGASGGGQDLDEGMLEELQALGYVE